MNTESIALEVENNKKKYEIEHIQRIQTENDPLCTPEIQCNHAHENNKTIAHKDHVDYIFNNEIHHIHQDHCHVVGHLEKKIRAYDYYSLFREMKPEIPAIRMADKIIFKIMIFFIFTFFFVELIVGLQIGSLALQADAFHMASDLIALIIGYNALIKKTKSSTEIKTYGWARSEIIGALINAVFLFSTCFNIAIEAIHRFQELDEVREKLEKDVNLLLLVAAIGLAINLVGVFMFSCCGLSHGHAGHDHGHGHGNEHGHGHGKDKKKKELSHDHTHGHSHENAHGHEHKHEHEEEESEKKKHSHNLNKSAVLLHIIGDTLGSVAVILSGLVIKYATGEKRVVIDPICSLFIVTLILFSATPVFKRAYHILLQGVPPEISISKLKKIIEELDGVNSVHDLHVWQLNEDKILANMHINKAKDFMNQEILDKVKLILHKQGIHFSTIQIEENDDKEHCREPVCANVEKCKTLSCCH